MTKLELKEAVIVEGRYDKIKLTQILSSPVIDTGGFRLFKDREKQALIRKIAEKRGILVMTDVDSAGFVIRNFLRGIVSSEQIKHAYIPTVIGKESRKAEVSKEGILGVEGIDREALVSAIRNSGVTIIGENTAQKNEITKADFYDFGLSGRDDSAILRKRVLTDLGLPEYLTANAMISAINCLFNKEEFEKYLNHDR